MAQATLAEIPRPELPDPDTLYEVVDGRVKELSAMGTFTSLITTEITVLIGGFLRGRALGRLACETLFILDPATNLRRRPDLAFVSFATWPADRKIPREGDWTVVPDLAIEVISPNDLDQDVHIKLRDYFRVGVKRVWLVRPEIGMVYDYESPKRVTIVESGEELDGGDLLPGFRLEVGLLFKETAT